MFEIPRQQDAEININEPEIMQFKSSQKLLDSNQSTPKKKSQLSQNPLVSTPQRGSLIDQKELSEFSESMNQSRVSNPFYSMPSQMELNKILQTPPTTKPVSNFEWSLEQQARIRPAVFDSDFNYVSPMNSEFDMKNDTFWSNNIIAPSPVHQPRNFNIIPMLSSSTQTDVSIPIDFNLAAILPSFQEVSSRSFSFHLSSSSDQSSNQNDISDGTDFGERQRCDLDGDELPTNFLDDLEISPIGSVYGGDE
uniref:Uncharacterized protein n=1 Tax=Panagrolaimus davidi TaxID=227884 RepID=A0A914PXL5_9BILA